MHFELRQWARPGVRPQVGSTDVWWAYKALSISAYHGRVGPLLA
ncbi:hypothetical protein ABIB34_001114 [Rhodococcus sp. UYP5]